jgi:tubulin--tyrosine ligase-like protein 12
MSNIECITVDSEIEEYLWKEYAAGTLFTILPSLKYINNYALVLGQSKDEDKETTIRYVISNLWKIARSFRVSGSNEPYWYVMDELGSALNHSDIPNMALFPLLYSPSNDFSKDMTPICVMWPISDLLLGSLLYRDFLNGVSEVQARSARLSVWYDTPKDFFITQNAELKATLTGNFKEEEVVKAEEKEEVKHRMRVFTDAEDLKKHLNLPTFEITENVEITDIIWLEKATLVQKK